MSPNQPVYTTFAPLAESGGVTIERREKHGNLWFEVTVLTYPKSLWFTSIGFSGYANDVHIEYLWDKLQEAIQSHEVWEDFARCEELLEQAEIQA